MSMKQSITIFLFFLGTMGAHANELIVNACEVCSDSQMALLARNSGTDWAVSSGDVIVKDVYIIRASDNEVKRFLVTSQEIYQHGEPLVSTTLSNATPNVNIAYEIKSALDFVVGKNEPPIDYNELPGLVGYTPIGSAHEVVVPGGRLNNFTQQLNAYVNSVLLSSPRSDTFWQTVKGVIGLSWVGVRTIKFPDGTTIKVKFKGINVENGETQIEVEVNIGSAKDGEFDVPITQLEAQNFLYTSVSGERLERFLWTAAMHGIPIVRGGGGTVGKYCYWDGEKIQCRKTTQ
ncbi:hypothetical protein [Permianibacter aggregans]|uniref:Uncharacterized protein n=1 Tax=Permianibacter aggregans TaxID=1510150 RepID=A0A4R6UI71_9GAMM|nr:hypothetical protein [Permianibacter aggregans]QGX40634.1 hypothetical protein E2H98_13535 [Permianibacter aggregans]TDQ46501.1 hypothetical protein EV696_11342 [Permianibacter aggregans]